MTVILTFLIATPFIAVVSLGIAADERWQLTDRIADTRFGRWARQQINTHIDNA